MKIALEITIEYHKISIIDYERTLIVTDLE